ncbi:cutinase [Colletotrichum musicola]|uniref:Cutinase n=1 Tax=Colletotrichum musicola TaxID=2175873 RepID=A0A8H6JHY2_9PEZI|nr:cutinase [Colletotrichum musicola]
MRASATYASVLSLLSASTVNAQCASGVHIISANGVIEGGVGKIGEFVTALQAKVPGSDTEAIPFNQPYAAYVQAQPAVLADVVSRATSYAQKCPDTPIVLAGLNRGAHAVMDAVCGASSDQFKATEPLPADVLSKIAAIVTFSDYSWLPGQPWSRGDATGPSTYPRKNPAGCDPVATKIASYCAAKDSWCDKQTTDFVENAYLPAKVPEAVDFVVSQLGNKT